MPRIAIAVNDFSFAVDTFRDKLGMPVIDLSESSVSSLGAKLAMCVPKGGSNIELMSPAVPAAPLSQSLQRFLDRRGEGLFALMLEAPDPNAEAIDLSSRGLNVLPLMPGTSGCDIHPNSTHGVLIRVYPLNSFEGKNQDRDSNSKLSGIIRVLIAVREMEDAVDVYGDKFAMEISEPSVDADRGVRSAMCRPPSGGMIELVSVEERSRPFAQAIEGFLDSNGEGMYALVLQSSDPEASANALSARGLRVSASDDSPAIIEIERASTFGALLRIEPVPATNPNRRR